MSHSIKPNSWLTGAVSQTDSFIFFGKKFEFPNLKDKIFLVDKTWQMGIMPWPF